MSDERRAALEAAFDKAAEPEQNVTPEPEVSNEPKQLTPEPEVQPKVQQEAKPDTQRIEQEAANRPPVKKPETLSPDKPKVEQAPTQSVNAPLSWKPGEREHWGKIPPEAQAAIQRREKEIQQAISQTSGARKFQDEFVNVVKPFSHIIRAQNSTPLQAVQNLMTTAAGLVTGSAEQKAQIVSEIIANYGVDIATLDAVLSKQPVPKGAGRGSIPQEIAQALQPVYGFMDEIKQAREQHNQRMYQTAKEEVEKFRPPFIEDLSNDMADLMDYAASKGQEMTIQQAYDVALNLNPDIKKLVDQKAAAAQAQENQTNIARKRAAASSLAGAPVGGAAPTAPTTRRAAIEAAFNGASR